MNYNEGGAQSKPQRRKALNILFITPEYPKRKQPTTGFPNYLYRVSLSLIQLGHKPIILSAGDCDGHRVEEGIEIWTVRRPYSAEHRLYALNYMENAWRIGSRLSQKIEELEKKMPIDIVQFPSLYGLALFYRGKIPAILRFSSYSKKAFASFQTHSRMEVAVMSLFERLSARKCLALISPCKNTAEAFMKDCHRKVKVIETPFVNDVKEYDNQFYEDILKEKKYALFFGTLYAEKGILVIAEVLESFLRENPDYYFVFLGGTTDINGECSANILQKSAGRYADRVIISKALPHEQLYPVIRYADFIVQPSFMENLSNACIEAMYFEKVVIGTDGASFEQLITHGQNGLLCRIGDSKDLLEKMQMAVSMDRKKKIEMGRMAKCRIDKLRPEYVVKKLVRLYEYVLSNSPNK